MRLRFSSFVFAASACLLFLARVAAAEPELHARAGLPNLAKHAKAGGEFRVAYLGGSITAAEGWRVFTTAQLRSQFPQLKITEINAGLPGTGSDLGVCRLDEDVLRHRPDLLFVEFAVNDTRLPTETVERTIEGIVRQARRTNPDIDIWFVYTVSTPALPNLEAGRFQPSAQAMERIAGHYGIPSLHLGVEVVKQIAAHALVFKAPDRPDDPTTFSLDGVHPTTAGHRVYSSVVERALPQLLAVASPARAALPAPLHTDNWEGARLLLADEQVRRGEWNQVPLDDANLRGATKNLLPAVWRTEAAGSAVEFAFTGEIFGLLGMAAPDSGEFRVTVDGDSSVEGTFFDSFVSPTFCRQREWFYPKKLSNTTHRVRVELIKRPFDKIEIKAKANRPATAETAPYEPQRLTVIGALVVENVTH
ncbi:SGNH/GDSL hydrolase family protein [Oleiharenicola lentus]|uniref:SGNH/GDSL hydrolase family protein n=1 Tax=Oleiharenicola lentus TaxID=2508720 RepID=UPI003F67C908